MIARSLSMRMPAVLLVLTALSFGPTAGHADDYPDGCISCHVSEKLSGPGASRIDLLLASVGHSKAGERTLVIPDGCRRCHAPDDKGTATALGKLIHVVHFRGGAENSFLKRYKGDCSFCHGMDTSDWEVVAKSGERNWGLKVGAAD